MTYGPIQPTRARQVAVDRLCRAADARMRAEAARHPAACPWCARGYRHVPMRFYPHAHVGPPPAPRPEEPPLDPTIGYVIGTAPKEPR